MSGVRGLPDLAVEVEGAPLARAAAACLARLEVAARLSSPTRCDLVFDGVTGALAELGLTPGRRLVVRVAGADTPLFVGATSGLEVGFGPDRRRRVRVCAYDALHQLRRRQAVRAYIEASLAAIAGELAGGVGLDVECHGAAPTWRYLVNDHDSDLAFLSDLAARAGFYLTARAATLHLVALDGLGDAVALELGDTLLEAAFELGDEPAGGAVAVLGWDARAPRGLQARAEAPRARPRLGLDDFDAGDGSEHTLVDRPLAGEDDAHAAAQAALDVRAARQVVLRGVASGDARLRPGTPVDIAGVGAELGARYVLTAVTHTVDGRGFLSALSSAPPPSPPSRRGAVITLGKVTRVDDPDGRGRVKASLPSYGDIESEWLHVLAAGAGANKGLAALPDVNDLVLLALAHEDAAHAVVLGSLYGEGGPADSGVEGGAVRRYTLATPGGNRLRFDDAQRRVRLENGDGSYVELGPDEVRLHAAADLVLEAPGRALVVRADSVDFRRG